MRRVDRARAARRTRRGVDAALVERDEQRLGLDARGTRRAARPATRRAGSPLIDEPGDRRRAGRASSRSRSAAMRATSSAAVRVGQLRARSRARRCRRRSACRRAGPCSWPPPSTSGTSVDAVAHDERADALRAAELVAGDRDEVGGRGVRRAGRATAAPAPRRCAAPRAGARSRTSAATSASGCTMPVSLLTSITETTAVRSSSASASASRSTPAVGAGADRGDAEAFAREPARPRRAPPCARCRS